MWKEISLKTTGSINTHTHIYVHVYTHSTVCVCVCVYVHRYTYIQLPLNRVSFNFTGPLSILSILSIFGYFSIINTTALNVCGWLNLGTWRKCGYERPSITYMQTNHHAQGLTVYMYILHIIHYYTL